MDNITFENFRSVGSQYGLDIDQYWQGTTGPNTGSVALSNLVFKNFTGSIVEGAVRPPLRLRASNLTNAINVTILDFSVWTEIGKYVENQIANFFGTGDDVYGPNNGLKTLSAGEIATSYTTSVSLTASPTGWTVPTVPVWAVGCSGYGSK